MEILLGTLWRTVKVFVGVIAVSEGLFISSEVGVDGGKVEAGVGEGVEWRGAFTKLSRSGMGIAFLIGVIPVGKSSFNKSKATENVKDVRATLTLVFCTVLRMYPSSDCALALEFCSCFVASDI